MAKIYRIKVLIVAVVLAFTLTVQVAPAFASCTYQTITYPNGRMVTCTTCCYGSSCFTNCL